MTAIPSATLRKTVEWCKLGRELDDCPLKAVGCGWMHDAPYAYLAVVACTSLHYTEPNLPSHLLRLQCNRHRGMGVRIELFYQLGGEIQAEREEQAETRP